MSTTNEKSIEEVLVDVIRVAASHFNGQYHVVIGTDDGGKVIEVRVEMKDPQRPLLEEHPKFPVSQIRKCGGRIILFKVPVGARKKYSS